MAESEFFLVRKVRQNECNDVFEVVNKDTGESIFRTWPRSMEVTCDEVLSDLA